MMYSDAKSTVDDSYYKYFNFAKIPYRNKRRYGPKMYVVVVRNTSNR